MTETQRPNEEVLDGVPVLAPGAALEPSRFAGLAVPMPAAVPVRQAAALAATGFFAGAAAVVVAGHRPHWPGRRRRRRRKGVLGEIVSSNSFLVDVHLIRKS